MTSKSRGYSLLEMLVGLAVLTVVSAATFALYSQMSMRYRVEMETSTLTGQSERAMNQIMRDLRLAGYPSSGMYGLDATLTAYTGAIDNLVAQGFIYNAARATPAVNAGVNSLTFEAALGARGASTLGVSNPIVSIVNYSLTGAAPSQTLVRTVTPKLADGSPGTAVATNILQNVSSLQFSYFDNNGNAISAVTLANAPSVAEVRITIGLQTSATDMRSGVPVNLTTTGGVYVRR